MASREIRLRYAGQCVVCGLKLPSGATALHDGDSKTIACITCAHPEPVADGVGPKIALGEPTTDPAPISDRGTAGASAAREHDRRSAKREESILKAHPRLGGLILAVTDDPQSTKAWQAGAKGEETVGKRLDALEPDGVIALHDRRIPRSRANIDHIAIAQTGVWIIDAKRYLDKRPTLRVEGGLIRPRTERLMIGSRDGSSLVAGVVKQEGLVRAVLDERGFAHIPIHGVVCFVDADWPLFGGSFAVEGIHVVWPKEMAKRLRGAGDIAMEQVEAVAALLAAHFPTA